LPTPLIILTSAASPWSHHVVRTLARRFDIDVLDCNVTADAGSRSALEDSLVAELRQVCRVHLLPPRLGPLHLLRGAARLRALRGSGRTPVLCLYGGMQATMAWLSGVRPYMVYVVGSDVLLAAGVRRALLGPTLRGAATVFANGKALADRARALVPDADVRSLYLGIDVERFRAPALAPLAPRFVCTRAFRPVYDNTTIVRALADPRLTAGDVALTFLSAGPLLDETIALADSLIPAAIRHRVTFARGVPEEQLIATLHRGTAYISASLSDGASASLLEAMAAGLFPIVSDIPANREWITHRDNGLLFPPGDSRALADAMAETLRPEPWMERARERNQRTVAERADIGRNLVTLADALAAAGAR
jgi:glycosyltransferase involved in cell wall biosynthesis